MRNSSLPRALSSIHAPLLLILLGIHFACLGCSKKEMDEMVSKAKESASELSDKSGNLLEKAKTGANDAATSIKQTTAEITNKTAELTQAAGNLIQLNGSAVIQLDKETTFPASYVSIVPLSNGQSIVQVKSYPDLNAAPVFPAFLLQGTAELSSGILDGQSVACRLFAQQQPDSQVWTNDPGELVLLNFKKRGKTLTANFSKSTVVNQDAETTLEASGVFECVILN
ncbi:hypothetical protein N9B43_07575 [Mariniblastus sp.]|nr:hypothetical protein [Mariniblastus sp.]